MDDLGHRIHVLQESLPEHECLHGRGIKVAQINDMPEGGKQQRARIKTGSIVCRTGSIILT